MVGRCNAGARKSEMLLLQLLVTCAKIFVRWRYRQKRTRHVDWVAAVNGLNFFSGIFGEFAKFRKKSRLKVVP